MFLTRRITILTVVALFALVTVVCLAVTRGKRKPGANDADQSNVQGLVFAIRPTGFDPPSIQVTKGTYLFIVQNRCGIRDLTFTLTRETGGALHEVHDQKLQWKKIFDLNPGTYELTVVDHPEWRSVITVRAR